MRLIAKAALGALAVATLASGVGTPADAARVVVAHRGGVTVARSYRGGYYRSPYYGGRYYRHGRVTVVRRY